MIDTGKRSFGSVELRSGRRWFAVVVAIEIVSALTIFHPLANTIACAVAGLVVFVLTWKKPTFGLAAMALELLIGSKGYLLTLGGWPSPISLRVIMTAMFFLGWLMNLIQHRAYVGLPKLFIGRRGYLVLFVVIAYATLRGMMQNGMGDVVGDGNAWGDWFLLFPVLDIGWRYRDRIRQDVVPALFVGVAWLALKTLGLEYLFSHGFKGISTDAYLWVRRTGVGEVTLVTANAFRIFMQSYIYAIPTMIAAVGYWFVVPTEEALRRAEESPRRGPSTPSNFARDDKRNVAWWMMVAATVILGISLSRSFWIGTFVALVVLVIILTVKRVAWWKRLLGPITAGVAGVAIVFAVLAFPLPPVNYASLTDLFGSRTNLEEAAAASRWNLLPVLWHKIEEHPILGSGFGASVTYESKDPRIVAQTGGMYTTYAFEWGWLEHWIKFGIIGIPLIAYLLWSLGKRLWKLDEPLWLKTAAVSSLVALAAVHFFTPYLNHPLGFLFFFVGEGIILSSRPRLHTA